MEKIGLVIDEGADLIPELIQQHNIVTVPIKLNWPEIEVLSGENIYQKMRVAEKRSMKTFGKTSQPSPKDFLVAYQKQLKNFEKIICITLTSKLSGTYNSACQGKNFLTPKDQKGVFVIDSLNVSAGQALLVLKAVEYIETKNLDAEQIVEKLENLKSKVFLKIIFKDPKWVETAGRMSALMANWIRRGQKMGLRPLIGMKKGVLKSAGLKTGAKDMVVALLKEVKGKTKKLQEQNKEIKIIIVHGDNLPAAQRLKELLEKEVKGARVIFINLVNDIVGSIAGPDALALAWIED
jgi:DegV family protein with EDD domain